MRLVGGRIHQLIAVKSAWMNGVSFEDTARELRQKEREKFLDIFKKPSAWKVIDALRKAPGRSVLLSRLIEGSNPDDVDMLLSNGVISCTRDKSGLSVTFESRLTEHIVGEFYQGQNQGDFATM